MHEQSLMNDLMAKISQVAAEERARGVTAVTVWLGAFSHMSPTHFAEHFENAARGTIAEGARIHCETSDDLEDPDAQDIRLLSIDLLS